MKLSILIRLLAGLIMVLLGACAAQNNALAPVEQEQIENVVKDYFTRDTAIPDYDVTVEETTGDWARVSINPVGAENAEATLYLQKHPAVDAAATATLNESPGNEGRVTTTTGWTIILGPQADFSEARLNEVGIPEEIRP